MALFLLAQHYSFDSCLSLKDSLSDVKIHKSNAIAATIVSSNQNGIDKSLLRNKPVANPSSDAVKIFI